MISFFAPGVPKPGGSKRAFVNPKTGRAIVTEDCKGNREWRAVVADCASLAMAGSPPLEGPLRVDVVFHLLRPKAHYRQNRRWFDGRQIRESAPPHPTTRPDATKLWRAAEDSLKAICWADDAQVVEQHVYKRYSDRSGAEIRITPLAPASVAAESHQGLFPERIPS